MLQPWQIVYSPLTVTFGMLHQNRIQTTGAGYVARNGLAEATKVGIVAYLEPGNILPLVIKDTKDKTHA